MTTPGFFQKRLVMMTQTAPTSVRQAARQRDSFFPGFNMDQNAGAAMRIHQLASEGLKRNVIRNVLVTKLLSAEDISG